MADTEKHLYHCDRCGELFQSEKHTKKEILCRVCGLHPVKSKFSAPPIDENAKKNAKHDQADIISLKKRRNRKNWIIVCTIWLLGLAAIAFVIKKSNNNDKTIAEQTSDLTAADQAYLDRKEEAEYKCAIRFRNFATTAIPHAKSSHIVNGSNLVLNIKKHYARNSLETKLIQSRFEHFDLFENGENTKALALLKYIPKKRKKETKKESEDSVSLDDKSVKKTSSKPYYLELLFWKKDDTWLIDWPHFIRLGEANWFSFNENKELNSPKRFKLYIRELSTESIDLKGYTEYKLSKAQNNSSKPNHLSQSVFVRHQTDFRVALSRAFKKLGENRKQKTENRDLFGRFDPPNTIRLDATLDFEEIDGLRLMVLKEIHAYDWETPPTEED